jgi:cell division protein FtsL
MDTWGISGPQFLLIYLVLSAVAVLAMALVRRWVLAGDGAAVPARLDL